MSRSDADKCDAKGKFRVLLIGSSGQFGAKLAQLLAAENTIELILAGRRLAPLEQLQQTLKTGEILALDRDSLDANTLKEHDVDIVADLSGPYQKMHSTVVKAAISAGIHYIDIADSRDYINAVCQNNAEAKKACCAVMTGASSTPALSHAVVEALTTGWQRVDSIEATICPSNSQDYGLSVIRGILGQVGKPMSLFTGGAYRKTTYWSNTVRRKYPRLGARYSSLVETPDNDLFVSRFNPVQSASFRASLELSLMHRGVGALSRLVQCRLMPTAVWLASPLRWIANRLSFVSSQYGGMTIEVSGRNAGGDAVSAKWALTAKGDAGPHVPVLACLIIVRKLATAVDWTNGAQSCAGLVTLDEFNREFAKLGIETQTSVSRLPKPPFEIALGQHFAILPAITQSVHSTAPSRLLKGKVTVRGADKPLTKLIARLFRMPSSSTGNPISTAIELTDSGTEQWARYFPDKCMRSRMGNPDPEAQTIDECFGPFCFSLKLDAIESGIDMHLVSGRFLNIGLPAFCLPRISATERVNQDKHLFDVEVHLPLLGRLVHYNGWLKIED